MRNRDKLVRGTCLGLILFLIIYCSCLLFSGYTGVEIPWVRWLQQQIVQGCLAVCQPASTGQSEGAIETFTWQDGTLHLVAAALDWPVVLEPSDNDGNDHTYAGDTLEGAGSGTTQGNEEYSEKESNRKENTQPADEIWEESGEDESNYDFIHNESGEDERNSNVIDKKSGEGEKNNNAIDSESGEDTDASNVVSNESAASETSSAVTAAAVVQVQPTLLSVESDIRPEISQLPAIAGLDTSQMLDFNYLLQKLYVVNSGCSVTEEVLNPRTLLSKDLTISHEGEGYEILIYHTHSQEAFANSVPGDVSQTVVGLGDYLTSLLEEKGYRVLHHTGIYDMENGVLERDYAYDRALPVLEQILAENPSIQVVIDLHRDGVSEGVHLVTDVNGEQTARIMFFNGMCRNETGERTDVTNPYREDNLAFSLQSALQLESYYPGMLRVVYLKQSRYNQHLRSRSMLVEIGAQTNTVEEVYRSIPVLADILSKVLQ